MHLRHAVPILILCLFAGLVAVQLPGQDEPALAASKTVTDAVTVIESGVAWNQRLRAFEILKRDGGADAISELFDSDDYQALVPARDRGFAEMNILLTQER